MTTGERDARIVEAARREPETLAECVKVLRQARAARDEWYGMYRDARAGMEVRTREHREALEDLRAETETLRLLRLDHDELRRRYDDVSAALAQAEARIEQMEVAR